MSAESDPALGLRVRKVKAEDWDTASAFLAKFQSTAARLNSDERIKLEVYTRENLELLKAVLADPQANKTCSLFWAYNGDEDVNSIAPLLTNNCPDLASLRVNFVHHSAFDFFSSVLEHPNSKIKVLEMPRNKKGNIARFFAALGQSQVSALTLDSYDCPKFCQGLYEYLAKDLLVRLKVSLSSKPVPSEMMRSLAKCARLAKLQMSWCTFSQRAAFTHLPKSITKLVLEQCTFLGGFGWFFLADGSNVQELDFLRARGVNGDRLGSALAVHLRAKGLDRLRFDRCDFADETLVAVGLELGRVKRLHFDKLNDASVELIALTLHSPNNEMKELKLEYNSSIDNHLVPALRHPNCTLAKLSLWANQAEHKAAARRVEIAFRSRRALFVLLQGQQVRRLHCPLRRLPVEMFRLVGEVLI